MRYAIGLICLALSGCAKPVTNPPATPPQPIVAIRERAAGNFWTETPENQVLIYACSEASFRQYGCNTIEFLELREVGDILIELNVCGTIRTFVCVNRNCQER